MRFSLDNILVSFVLCWIFGFRLSGSPNANESGGVKKEFARVKPDRKRRLEKRRCVVESAGAESPKRGFRAGPGPGFNTRAPTASTSIQRRPFKVHSILASVTFLREFFLHFHNPKHKAAPMDDVLNRLVDKTWAKFLDTPQDTRFREFSTKHSPVPMPYH